MTNIEKFSKLLELEDERLCRLPYKQAVVVGSKFYTFKGNDYSPNINKLPDIFVLVPAETPKLFAVDPKEVLYRLEISYASLAMMVENPPLVSDLYESVLENLYKTFNVSSSEELVARGPLLSSKLPGSDRRLIEFEGRAGVEIRLYGLVARI